MKRYDKILVAGVVLCAVTLLLIFYLTGGGQGNQIRITIDGELYGTYSLDQNQEIEVKQGEDYNLVCIEDGKAYMKEANCPDGYCEDQGMIWKQNQTIVCLPHKLVVEVSETAGVTDETADIVAK